MSSTVRLYKYQKSIRKRESCLCICICKEKEFKNPTHSNTSPQKNLVINLINVQDLHEDNYKTSLMDIKDLKGMT